MSAVENRPELTTTTADHVVWAPPGPGTWTRDPIEAAEADDRLLQGRRAATPQRCVS